MNCKIPSRLTSDYSRLREYIDDFERSYEQLKYLSRECGSEHRNYSKAWNKARGILNRAEKVLHWIDQPYLSKMKVLL